MRPWIFIGFCLFLAATARGDRVTLLERREHHVYHTASYERSVPEGRFRFLTASGDRSIAIGDLRTIDLRDRDGRGRAAHVTLDDGRSYFHTEVQMVHGTPEGMVVRVKLMGAPPEDGSHALALAKVSSIEFAPPTDSEMISMQAAAQSEADGLAPEILDFQFMDPNPAPRAAQPTNPWDQVLAEQARAERGIQDPTQVSGDPSNQTAFAAFAFFGLMIGGTAIIVTMVAGFVLGGFMLRFSAGTVGITDVSMPRFMACSALLATIPPVLFIVVFWIFPLFYGFKLFCGLAAFYFSSRMLVMGFLEVLEKEAIDILVMYYATWVLLLILTAKLL